MQAYAILFAKKDIIFPFSRIYAAYSAFCISFVAFNLCETVWWLD